MARLYVANCTPQFRRVCYRMDFAPPGTMGYFKPARQQTLPPGRQEPIGGDLHLTQVEEIVRQLSGYGLRGVIDIGHLKHFTPLVFNIDKPVTRVEIQKVMDHNKQVRVLEGAERRRKAAVAASHTLTRVTEEPVSLFEVGYEQEEVSAELEPAIAQGFRMGEKVPTNDAAPPPAKRGRPRSAQRAAVQ